MIIKVIKLAFIIWFLSVIWIIYYRPTKYSWSDMFNYKLGDIVLYEQPYPGTLKKIYNYYYQDSIAHEYLNKTNQKKLPNYDILYEIVKKRSENIDKPDNRTLVIHLRIGDVIEWEYSGSIDKLLNGTSDYKGSAGHEYLKDYKYFEENIQKVKNKIDKIVIVGGYHISRSQNRSQMYVEKICNFLENKGFIIEKRINQKSADEDFLYMCNSKYFLKSGGGYSKIINNVVKNFGNNCLVE